MKVFLTGGTGQLGSALINLLRDKNIEYSAPTRKELDLKNKEKIKCSISKYKPDIIIHSAAYTNVEKAELEKDLAYKVNVESTKWIAKSVKEIDAKLLYISSDYVFDGKKEEAYENYDLPNPINYYGLTKYLGEKQIKTITDKAFIIRTSWLYGKNGNNFVKNILKLTKSNQKIKVIDDQIGSPTYTNDLAELILNIMKTKKYGIYHAVNEGFCSWYHFALEIVRAKNIKVNVKAIKSEKFISNIKRPKNSRLSTKSLENNGFNLLRNYKKALKEYLDCEV
ncbi:dTDP-4-dehydrorhamnose reductase [Halanaerobium hydrogeniformans]|uniref:dTDP-4-dehydrorhamnose reductase n=1 Tax=Halanaerobium hydrogeniformans TaxID=656519 RepID=E4RM07_HALHG|nr:dTDP-4-dehydrorhamnose reductase [Halanaerobium hydrogeniformans]ADQ14090.1 dTDP-4-dehydrorhamnose reductase [Halanaerobium hydrogeniformans]